MLKENMLQDPWLTTAQRLISQGLLDPSEGRLNFSPLRNQDIGSGHAFTEAVRVSETGSTSYLTGGSHIEVIRTNQVAIDSNVVDIDDTDFPSFVPIHDDDDYPQIDTVQPVTDQNEIDIDDL
jgi:hypothetical protein